MEKETEFSPAENRTWVSSVIDLHDNHYTTHTADSASEIKYLHMHPCFYGRLALSKVVIAFNDALQDTALKAPILILGR